MNTLGFDPEYVDCMRWLEFLERDRKACRGIWDGWVLRDMITAKARKIEQRKRTP